MARRSDDNRKSRPIPRDIDVNVAPTHGMGFVHTHGVDFLSANQKNCCVSTFSAIVLDFPDLESDFFPTFGKPLFFGSVIVRMAEIG